MVSTPHILRATLLGLVAISSQPAFAETLKKSDLDKLIAVQQGRAPATFDAFLAQAARAHPSLQGAVAAYSRKAPLTGDDLVNISRLLGLYSRLHSQDQVIASIEKMVAIPTVRNDKIPPYENPSIIEFGQLVEKMANDFGLQYRNVDNRVFEVKLLGRGKEEFGVLTHADVVPVVVNEWVLDNGVRLDPFKLTRVGGNLYGRGTIDDKCSIATVLYAMKAVKESGLPIDRTIRLMIDTTEETGGEGFKYYREKNALPEYNIVLDSKYPAVVAEKGTGALKVFFPSAVADDKQLTVTAMTAAASSNAIPRTSIAILKGGDLAQAAAQLEAAKAAFVQKYERQGGKFSIDIEPGANQLAVKVNGSSAHGSRPEEGVNSLPRLALFLRESGITLADNQYAKAIRYLTDLYGLDYLGGTMGLAYRDDFMGPLTMSPTFVRESNGKLEVTANVRMPRGNTPQALTQAVSTKIGAWAAKENVQLDVDYRQGDWMARDPSGAWLATLLNIFGDVTGQDAKPVSTAGSTTAKLLPNAINFGPAMPGKKYTAHNANEFKEVADLDADMQMFTEMLVRIGNLRPMQ